ncbi:MAG: gephyrin-like molybdotransferase Glp [Anaerolineaceae bacterium]
MTDLMSVQEAQERILSAFSTLSSEKVTLENCLYRVLAEPIFSDMNLPPFSNSSMDGFAVIASDLKNSTPENPTTLKVIQNISAGANHLFEIKNGQASRIMTGAPLPPGADSVIPIEFTSLAQEFSAQTTPDFVKFFASVESGENIRPQGMDIKAGEPVFPAWQEILPKDIGILAALGIKEVTCTKMPKIAILSTGDELLEFSEKIQPGKIRDTNRPTLKAMALSQGVAVIDLGIVPDDPTRIREKFDQAIAEKVDLIITSAGVSMGAFDYVREVIKNAGKLNFWKVNIRPGKPLSFGEYKGTPTIGLPGNPVSAFIGFTVFVLPVIYHLKGLQNLDRHAGTAILENDVTSDGRESYLRGKVYFKDTNNYARLTRHQGSGNLLSLADSNALLIIPSGVKSLPTGSEVVFWPLT